MSLDTFETVFVLIMNINLSHAVYCYVDCYR